MLHHGLQHIFDVQAGFGADAGGFRRVQADHVLDLRLHFLRLSAGKINFVDDGNDLQIGVQGHVYVGEGLGLDALGGVHHQQRALTGCQRTADLIGEVNMTGGINEVEGVGFAVPGLVLHVDGLGFDGDAAFPLQLHGVKNLLGHLALLEHAGHLQDAIRQGGLAVVNVGNDAEIANF